MSSSRDEREAVRGYLAALPPLARARVARIRAAVRAAAPEAVEGFSYRMPVFRLNGRPLLWVGAFQRHVGLYPMTAGVKRRLASALAERDVSKGTIRFPLASAPPLALVRRIVTARAAELSPSPPRAARRAANAKNRRRKRT